MPMTSEEHAIEIPERLKPLRRNEAGHPVFWFHDRPARESAVLALNDRICWFCGEKLGAHFAFVVTPVTLLTRSSPEPPGHRDCALYAAQASQGKLLYRGGPMLVVYVTKGRKADELDDRYAIRLGEPTEAHWFLEGEEATRSQSMRALELAFNSLLEPATKEGEVSRQQLIMTYAAATLVLPREKACQTPAGVVQ